MTKLGNPPEVMSLARAAAAAAYNNFDRWMHTAQRWRRAQPYATPDNCGQYLAPLRREGYVILPGYFDAGHCDQLIADIDRMMATQPDVLRNDAVGADSRIFGAERFSAPLASFGADRLLREVGEVYHRGALRNLATLAGRLRFVEGNIGSGQGWHRDAFHFQYKAMVYLTDVTVEHGPFQILVGSHRAADAIRDTVRGRLDRVPNSRISEEQVARLLEAEPQRLRTLAAPRGTVILFDSSTIHRGAPIRSGVRYALTNYYYRPDQCSPLLVQKFAPYARPSVS